MIGLQPFVLGWGETDAQTWMDSAAGGSAGVGAAVEEMQDGPQASRLLLRLQQSRQEWRVSSLRNASHSYSQESRRDRAHGLYGRVYWYQSLPFYGHLDHSKV